jgi:GDP-L-fucose synthase
MKKGDKIYIAGHRGLVGSAIFKSLKLKGYNNLLIRSHQQLDLTNQDSVQLFFKKEKPDYVILAAAKVGGIVANNTYRADFLYQNLMIQANVIHYAYKYKVKRLLFLGSTCIYPKNAPQPIKEESLLTSELEYSNEPYAIAKIAGIKMCENYNIQYGTDFISLMPTNLYGPNDNFDLKKSHVMPALIRKMFLSKFLFEDNWQSIKLDLSKNPLEGLHDKSTEEEVLLTLNNNGIFKDKMEIWGSGKPKREFLWSEDLAEACIFLLEKNQKLSMLEKLKKKKSITHINIGTGMDISIRDLADMIRKEIGYNGEFYFNQSKPDGTIRKLTDVSLINSLGWKHHVNLEEGIKYMCSLYSSSLI